MPVISGVTRDSSNALASRLVRAYRRDTGAFVGQVLSDPTTGAYSITTTDTSEHFVLAHDTADADPFWNQVVLACRFDGANGATTFTDLKGKAFTRFGNAQISTAQSKFGGSSLYLDGNGDYLTTSSSSDFDLFGPTTSSTVEFWVRFSSLANTPHIVTFGTSEAYRLTIFAASGFLQLWTKTNSSDYATRIQTSTISVDTWYHVALVNVNGTFSLYLNGALVGSAAVSVVPTGALPLIVGWQNYGGFANDYFNGYIDDLRITKGVARYTAAFSPPAAAFSASPVGGTENAVILDRVVPV